MPEFESLKDCLIACVKAAGGSKQVAAKIWPAKTIDAAQRHLLNCLEDTRAERLSPDQVLYLAKLARDAGCHAYMEYCAESLHYSAPVPREPQQELAALQRAFQASLSQQAVVLQRIEALMGSLPTGSGGLKAVG